MGLALDNETAESVIPCKPVDGEFPNYRQVLPKYDKDARTAGFNARYLAAALDALGTIAGERNRCIKLTVADTVTAARIDVEGPEDVTAFAIVMPCRM